MDPEIKQEVFSRIDALAAKLGVGVEHLWQTLIRQSVIEGWIELVTAFLCMLLAWTFMIGGKISMKKRAKSGKEAWKSDHSHNDPSLASIFFMLGCFASILTTMCFFTDLSESITQICNPEYFAFQELKSIVK